MRHGYLMPFLANLIAILSWIELCHVDSYWWQQGFNDNKIYDYTNFIMTKTDQISAITPHNE